MQFRTFKYAEMFLIGHSHIRIKIPKRVKGSRVLCLACSDCGEINRIYAENPERIRNEK